MPFFIRSDMGYDADGTKNDSNRIFHDFTTCRQGAGNEDLAIACFNNSYVVHTLKHTLFTLLILFCDVFEIVNVMRKWNVTGAYDTGVLVLKQHRELLNNYIDRYSIKRNNRGKYRFIEKKTTFSDTNDFC